MASGRGRSLQDFFDSLDSSVKCHCHESFENPPPSKRSRIIAELVPFVLPTSSSSDGGDFLPSSVGRKPVSRLPKEDEKEDEKKGESEKGENGSNAKEKSRSDKPPSSSTKEVATTHADNLSVEFIEYLKQQKEIVSQDMDRIEERRRNVFRKQAELGAMYKYGLTTIAKLTNLKDSPDAILPGNF